MAANSLLDRGWGKAAQLVDVQGDIRQLVEVQLRVVPARVDATLTQDSQQTKLLNDYSGVTLEGKRIDSPPGDGDPK